MPGIEPDPRPSQGRVRNPPHSEDMWILVARRGIEPRLAESKSAVRSSTLAGHEYPDLDLNQGLNLRRVQCYPLHHRDMFSVPRPGLEPGPGPSQGPMLSTTPPGSVVSIPPWNRTRTKTLGESRAIHYTSGTQEPTTGFAPASIRLQGAAFLCRATSAVSTSARSRTPYNRFGSCLLSQEHTRVGKCSQPGGREQGYFYFSSSTFQYAWLTNFDQLSIRTSRSA